MTSPAAPLLQYLMQPLARWLDDDATEDIAINEPGRAWVRHHGVWDAVELPLTLAELEDIAVLAGSLRRQEVAPLAPLCATELPGGERLQICIPP
ncbi:MAG: type IV secretion system protein VirB11, partial [Alphaproteobacteria bacterium]|nr:type IV secretion system protein VirB11 [Alphaproteobacteria bacterium]